MSHSKNKSELSDSNKQLKNKKNTPKNETSDNCRSVNGRRDNQKQSKSKTSSLSSSLNAASFSLSNLQTEKQQNARPSTPRNTGTKEVASTSGLDGLQHKKRKKEKYSSQADKKKKTRKSISCCTNERKAGEKSHFKNLPSTSQTQPSDSTEEDDSVQIPGFHYDKVKKRYFKILPTANNINVVTTKSISFREAECKRLSDLINQELNKSNLDDHEFHKLNPISGNITSLIFRHHQGDVNNHWLEHSFLEKQASWMKLCGMIKIFENPDAYSDIEHMLQMDASQKNDKILGLWSVANSVIQRMQLLNLNEKPRLDSFHPLSVGISTSGATVLQSWNKITSLCWAPFSSDTDKKHVLYTTMCYTGYNFSLAFIRNLDPSNSEHVQVFDYNLGNHTTWTSAWNYHAFQFAVGAEKICLLIDVETRRLWEFDTKKSDVFAQVFSPVNGRQLYNGTRRGQILCHDLRSLSAKPVACMVHNTSIACLKMTQNENTLYASDFNGRLCSWDLRMRKVVIEYPGLHNEYLRLPFKIDPCENFIYGVGQNCYTNFWCLKTGKKLLSLPPPCPASIDTIPAVHYSNHWVNSPGNTGLIMGVKDSLYFYSGRVAM